MKEDWNSIVSELLCSFLPFLCCCSLVFDQIVNRLHQTLTGFYLIPSFSTLFVKSIRGIAELHWFKYYVSLPHDKL
uniref:Uncharacterized protein n=1 Tax=Populus trichocarpa TaxID=3694 RepID=A0A2K1ZVT0_POPTR